MGWWILGPWDKRENTHCFPSHRSIAPKLIKEENARSQEADDSQDPRREKESLTFVFLCAFPRTRVSIQCFPLSRPILQRLLFRAGSFVSYTIRSIDDTKPIHDPRNRILIRAPLFYGQPVRSREFHASHVSCGGSRLVPLTREFSDTPPENRPLTATRSCPNSITQTTSRAWRFVEEET